ncbi:hypothetical protein EAE32_06800 [Kocuria tytonicola]|uniref:Uncharacterized protein n=1 Tax=Kocuria tytonicola TaxID=2055946 RepID=A0A3L9LCQ6_9MICC|nr:hypothetical protein EAE32_06800 [Kocuria tytonicola]
MCHCINNICIGYWLLVIGYWLLVIGCWDCFLKNELRTDPPDWFTLIPIEDEKVSTAIGSSCRVRKFYALTGSSGFAGW